ncbi:hypothetical protein ACIP98_28945 [Streptomyces sp. NPDC088354]|uniref:hypothetical protein n=1 Tax=Streptomyces sp. NPDC088354 TaxID=3365856 RepID=UPI00381775AC
MGTGDPSADKAILDAWAANVDPSANIGNGCGAVSAGTNCSGTLTPGQLAAQGTIETFDPTGAIGLLHCSQSMEETQCALAAAMALPIAGKGVKLGEKVGEKLLGRESGEEAVRLFRAPQKGNRASEARGLNAANHSVQSKGENIAYLGDSESVVRKYAGQGVYEDGYHTFTMKPGFLNDFHPSSYRRFHDNDGGLQWLIDEEDFDLFNSYIDHSQTTWTPWKLNEQFFG